MSHTNYSGQANRKKVVLAHEVPDDLPQVVLDKSELQLFDRFYRGSAAADNNAPGTGRGLSICKEILEKHGGKIEVDSGPGQGSEFTVWWPIAEEA